MDFFLRIKPFPENIPFGGLNLSRPLNINLVPAILILPKSRRNETAPPKQGRLRHFAGYRRLIPRYVCASPSYHAA